MFYILSLIALQIIWTSSYVAMKFALVGLPVGAVLIIRYGVAALVLLAAGCARGSHTIARRDLARMILLGIAVYSLSPFFQLKSLGLTQVIDVSILVATEPLITALLASLFLREKLTWELAMIFMIATAGVLVLSGVFSGDVSAEMTGPRLVGNLFFLTALVLEGLNTVGGRGLTQRYPPQLVAFWTHLSGFLFNLMTQAHVAGQIPWEAVPFKSWAGAVYLGLFCSAIGYTAWYFLVQKIEVSRLVLSLFLQPVIGIFFGYLLMGERLNLQTAAGAGLVLLPLLAWVIHHKSAKA